MPAEALGHGNHGDGDQCAAQDAFAVRIDRGDRNFTLLADWFQLLFELLHGRVVRGGDRGASGWRPLAARRRWHGNIEFSGFRE